MANFRLLKGAGTHREEGVDYNEGEVVESNRDLVKMFKNKFEKTADNPPTPSVKKPASTPSTMPKPKK